MAIFRGHSVRRWGLKQVRQKRKQDVAQKKWGAVGGEGGACQGEERGDGLDPEEEGGGLTDEGVPWGEVERGPGDGFEALHERDGQAEEQEGAVQVVRGTEEDSDKAEGKGLEADGGIPTHLLGVGSFVFFQKLTCCFSCLLITCLLSL